MLSAAMMIFLRGLLSSFFSATRCLLPFFCAALSLTSPPKTCPAWLNLPGVNGVTPAGIALGDLQGTQANPPQQGHAARGRIQLHWYNSNDLTFFLVCEQNIVVGGIYKAYDKMEKKITNGATPSNSNNYLKLKSTNYMNRGINDCSCQGH